VKKQTRGEEQEWKKLLLVLFHGIGLMMSDLICEKKLTTSADADDANEE
jgi:hypothetical protein